MKVIETIQSTRTDALNMRCNEPVEVVRYNGDDLALAMAAMVQAMADSNRDPEWVETLSIRIDF